MYITQSVAHQVPVCLWNIWHIMALHIMQFYEKNDNEQSTRTSGMNVYA